MPRPGDTDEVRLLEELIGVLPLRDLRQGVGACDEIEVRIRVLRGEVREVSIVKVVPPRSMSTRETAKRGFEAVAMTVIR